jgi:signal transduction histidine kinase
VRKELELAAGREGPMLRIDVADRGSGLSDAVARRMFDPYFTTKADGTGLGLAITQRIVTEHGGWIEAERREGGGARVVIRLPLEPDASRSVARLAQQEVDA